MATKGEELAQLRKTWNPRRWLRVRQEIKEFSENGFDLYILTLVLYATYVNLYLILTQNRRSQSPSDNTTFHPFLQRILPRFQVLVMSCFPDNIANINPVDEISPTEPVAGMLVTVDDDVDIEQAQSDIAEAVTELMSVSESDYSDVLSRKSECNLLDLF